MFSSMMAIKHAFAYQKQVLALKKKISSAKLSLNPKANSFVCLIWFFTSHQQSLSYTGTGLPGLNQY